MQKSFYLLVDLTYLKYVFIQWRARCLYYEHNARYVVQTNLAIKYYYHLCEKE